MWSVLWERMLSSFGVRQTRWDCNCSWCWGGYCLHSWQSVTPLTALAMLPRSGHSLLAFFAALVVAVQRCLLTLLTLAIKVTTYISASTFEVLILLLGEQPGIPGDLFNCHLAGNGYLQVSMVKGPTCTSLCQKLCLAV